MRLYLLVAVLTGGAIGTSACTTYNVREGATPVGVTDTLIAPSPPLPPSADTSARAKRIVVTTEKTLVRPCEIVAIFDLHTAATDEDKGFDELRERALAVGADAVIGAEFEHGEGAEPSHLSGMAVRFSAPRPPYDEIGSVDVESDGASTDKGLEEMERRRRALGADQIVGVTFEHGEGGARGHLRGRAVKYRR